MLEIVNGRLVESGEAGPLFSDPAAMTLHIGGSAGGGSDDPWAELRSMDMVGEPARLSATSSPAAGSLAAGGLGGLKIAWGGLSDRAKLILVAILVGVGVLLVAR